MTPATADPGLSEAELLEAAALPEAAEVLHFEQRTLTDRETVDLVALVSWTLSDREVVTASVNPDRFMVNQAVPSAVDRFKAVVWWFEPNLNDAPQDPAQLETPVCNEVSGICGPGTTTTPDAPAMPLPDTGIQ